MLSTGQPDAPPRRPARVREPWIACGQTIVRAALRVARRVGFFLGRQRGQKITRAQVACDVVGGVALPVFLVWLDRFWDPFGVDGVMKLGRVYVMLLAACGGVGVVVFHAGRTLVPRFAAATAAPLRLTGWIANGAGVLLLPFSVLLAPFYGLGLLGFLPFGIGFLHLRCAVRARRLAIEHFGRRRARWAGVAMTLAVLEVAAVGGKGAKLIANRDQQVLLGDRRGDEAAALRRLRVLWHFPGVPLVRLWQDFYRDRAVANEDRVDELHRRITGRVSPWSDRS